MNSGSSPASSGAGTSYEAARKRQMELLSEECKKLCNPDVDRPFKDVEDVVDRLLPYHLFYEYDAEEADLDETWDGEGAGLVMSRHEVWQQESLQMAQRAVDRMEELRGRIRREEQRVFGEVDEQPRQEDYLVEMWLLDQAQARLDATHAALAPTPPPASVPAAPLPATPLPAAAATSIAAAAASGLPTLSSLATPAGTALLGSFMQPPPGGN